MGNLTDPTFHRELMGLKTNAGGMDYRNTERRALFINAINSALPQMMGNERTAPLWASLADVIGADSFKEGNVGTCWQHFFDSGSEFAKEFDSEITRMKELRTEAFAAAQRQPTANEIFDAPNNRFGYKVEKLHRQLFNEIRSQEAEALL